MRNLRATLTDHRNVSAFRLHLYIHDYLSKRNFTAAAQALNDEASLGSQTVVPVDAPQGLLYEWWSVFWDVFSAGNPGKGGQPTADAQAYIEVSVPSRRVSRKRNPLLILPMPNHSTGSSEEQAAATTATATCSRHGSTRPADDRSNGSSDAASIGPVSRWIRASERCRRVSPRNDGSAATIPSASGIVSPTAATTERGHHTCCLCGAAAAATRARSCFDATALYGTAAEPEPSFACDDGSVGGDGFSITITAAVTTGRSRGRSAEWAILPAWSDPAHATASG